MLTSADTFVGNLFGMGGLMFLVNMAFWLIWLNILLGFTNPHSDGPIRRWAHLPGHGSRGAHSHQVDWSALRNLGPAADHDRAPVVEGILFRLRFCWWSSWRWWRFPTMSPDASSSARSSRWFSRPSLPGAGRHTSPRNRFKGIPSSHRSIGFPCRVRGTSGMRRSSKRKNPLMFEVGTRNILHESPRTPFSLNA